MRLSQHLPSGARSSKRIIPPTRTSASRTVVVKPFGPNQRAKCSFSVQALNTSSRGKSRTRQSTISRSSAHDGSAFLLSTIALLLSTLVLLFCLHLAQVVVQPIEALFPRA